MANQILTSQIISNTALAEFANNAPFVQTGSRIYQKDFENTSYKQGDTIQVRRQNNFIVSDGSVVTSQDIIETVENITIEHQYSILISYTMKDLTLSIGDFNRMFLQPAIQNIITQMEIDISTSAETQVNFFTGNAGTPINSFSVVDQAGTQLLRQSVNLMPGAYLATTLEDGTSLKSALLNQFTPIFNEDIVRTSAIGHISYFDAFQSQNIARHIAGAGPTLFPGDVLLVNGAVGSGNTIALDGATINIPNYFLPGDLISIAGVSSVNRISRRSTGRDMQFVVTAPANSDGAGNVIITVAPTIISSTLSPLQNVSNPIPDNAAVTAVGSYNNNMAYTSRGLSVCCPPLQKLQVPFSSVAIDPVTGLSLAISQAGDVFSNQNNMRLTMLCGFKWHPEYVCKLIS